MSCDSYAYRTTVGRGLTGVLCRFQDVLPIMERLRDLEQQVEEESSEPSRGSGRGGKHSGSAPNKNKKSSTSSSGKKR